MRSTRAIFQRSIQTFPNQPQARFQPKVASGAAAGIGIGFAPYSGGVRRVVSQGGLKLNPSASTFNPNVGAFAPPPQVPQLPQLYYQQQQQQLQSGLAAPFKPGFRNFSAPSGYNNQGLLPVVIKPIRQPKGPCSDEELATKNFSARQRARAINTLRRGRLSAPPSPTESEHQH